MLIKRNGGETIDVFFLKRLAVFANANNLRVACARFINVEEIHDAFLFALLSHKLLRRDG